MRKICLSITGALLLIMLQTGCRALSGSGHTLTDAADAEWVRSELIMGLQSKTGTVSPNALDTFIDEQVTPRFQHEIFYSQGHSQYWRRQDGFIEEPVCVLVLIHRDTLSANAAINFIARQFERRFDTTPVRRMSMTVQYMPESPPVHEPLIRELCSVPDGEITESSGLACSRTQAGLLWTHNDSGDMPRFFGLHSDCRTVSAYRIRGAEAVDWEDMCAGVLNGQQCLLFADVGDNDAVRREVCLYLVPEPDEHTPSTIPLMAAIPFTYEDGPHDCEAVGWDSEAQVVYLVTKQWGWSCGIYALDLKHALQAPAPVRAGRVGELALPLVTAMDISEDNRHAVVLTYGDAYEYDRAVDESWPQAFKRQPRPLAMPRRRQGESICYGLNDNVVYLTTEHLPMPLWEVIIPDRSPGDLSPVR